MRVFVVLARRSYAEPYILAVYANAWHADADAERWAGRGDGRQSWVEPHEVQGIAERVFPVLGRLHEKALPFVLQVYGCLADATLALECWQANPGRIGHIESYWVINGQRVIDDTDPVDEYQPHELVPAQDRYC